MRQIPPAHYNIIGATIARVHSTGNKSCSRNISGTYNSGLCNSYINIGVGSLSCLKVKTGFLAVVLTVLLLVFSARFAATAAPIPATTYFKQINMASGLPDNSVNHITEDKFGFLWIATWNGLARFDGTYVKTYRHNDSASSLSNNMVRTVLAVDDGIWIGTDAGVDFMRFSDSRFFPGSTMSENGEIIPLGHRVSHLFRNDGKIFALTGEGNLLRLDEQKNVAKGENYNLFHELPKPQSRRYADFTPFENNKLMALSNEGITLLSPDGERELYHNNLPFAFDPNLNIYYNQFDGRVYVGAGIGRQARIFRLVNPKGQLAEVTDGPKVWGLMETVEDNGVTYLATDGNGLYMIPNTGAQEESLVQYLPKNSSLPSDAVYSVFVDSNHNLWSGTYRHGLCMMSHELNSYTLSNIASGSLSYDIVTAIVPQGDKLFLGLDGGGLDIYDIKTGKSVNFNTSNSPLPGNNLTSMVFDGNSLWAAVYSKGLVEISPQTKSISTYSINTGDDSGNKLWVIADDGRGNIWVGGRSLHLFNKNTRQFTSVEGTENLDIMALISDGPTIWAATRQGGVLKIDKTTRRIEERFSDSPSSGGTELPGYHVPYIFLDSSRHLWVNVGNKDLCRLDLTGKEPAKIYNSGSGLPNPHVLSMIEDARGNLWIGTDDGLYKFIRARETFIRKKDSHVPPTYTQQATAVVGDTAYFGSTNGLLSFPLDAPTPGSSTVPTVFTGVKILDRDRTEIPLYTDGNDDEVHLKSGQNFFTVTFAVPEMSNPEQMQYECRLEGLENVWRDVTTTHSATYTNVPDGSYTLLVRHTNPDGSWTDPRRLIIHVDPAWYASVPMLMVWLLLFCLLVFFGLRIWRKYINNEQKTRIAELERDSIKRLNEAKLDFYASITHELRTPCFLISAQLEEILDSERQAVPVAALNGVYRNSNKLNKLINHIIDFRKNDIGHLKLMARRTELVKFFSDLTMDYEQMCRQKSLDFTFEHDPSPIEAMVDSDKLEQIMSNLISNAYKYTPRGGSVTLGLHDEGENVVISVADTGIGVVDKLQSAIFKPFYRTERGKEQSTGDGIGLAFVKELVELHHGTILLESEVDKGSIFTVVLPKKQPEADVVAEVKTETAAKPIAVAQAPSQTPAEHIANPTATRSILIVDDDPEVQALVGRAFEDDYRIVCSSDAEKAIELAREGNFDVIITDLMMPDVDGHQLIRTLKSDKKTRNVKIVVFSALTSEDDTLHALDEGADAFLTKPTALRVLRRQVDRLFETDPDSGDMSDGNVSGAYNREEQKFLLECRRVIDENMQDENFGIEMLAGKLNMSHSSLYKKIRRMTGLSLIDFINEYRIFKAVSLFRKGNSNVQKVAEMCGFRDIKTFRETFKRKMNMPPKQFILQLNSRSKDE